MKDIKQNIKPEDTEIFIHFISTDLERAENLKNNLKKQLIEFDNIKVLKLKSQPLPDGAMSSDAITIGALAIAVLPSLITTIINTIKEIKLKNKGVAITIMVKDGDREIHLEIPADSISVDKITELTDNYLQKLKK
jgi:hypothetical protein